MSDRRRYIVLTLPPNPSPSDIPPIIEILVDKGAINPNNTPQGLCVNIVENLYEEFGNMDEAILTFLWDICHIELISVVPEDNSLYSARIYYLKNRV